mmetsp:Transcript_19404/g.35256  ORF Transcript_19404/g.35256 Transcript_19404/m.35256 type:complete len:215 (+) Transcript_19404:2159-2803(+)
MTRNASHNITKFDPECLGHHTSIGMSRNVNASCVDWNRGGFDHIGNDLSQEFHIINRIVSVGILGRGETTTCSSIPTGSQGPVPIDSAQGPNDHKVLLLCQFLPPRFPRLIEWTPIEPMQIQHQWSSFSHCFILRFVIISTRCGWHICIPTPFVPIVQKDRPHLNADLFCRYLPKSIGSHIAICIEAIFFHCYKIPSGRRQNECTTILSSNTPH